MLLHRNRMGEDRQFSQDLWTWFTAGQYSVKFELLYDPLSAVFLLLITGVGALIHLFAATQAAEIKDGGTTPPTSRSRSAAAASIGRCPARTTRRWSTG